MPSITIKEPKLEDESAFLNAMHQSKDIHHPWVKPPLTSDEFREYLKRSQQSNQKCYLVWDNNNLVGVFNVSEIVRGFFQNAYLGFYVIKTYAGLGVMSKGLKLVLEKVFTELDLHRIEANIQPDNINSINLVKKNGFRKEGYSPKYLNIKGEWRDHERFAITVEDWHKKL
jgi:RimJ/RimL family protein N-acetyltransferase